MKAGVTHATAQKMLVRGLVDRDQSNRFTLTERGRDVFSALLDAEWSSVAGRMGDISGFTSAWRAATHVSVDVHCDSAL
jgi:hypothetical protein